MVKKLIKKKDPKWFTQSPSEDDKSLFKKALANYIARNYTTIQPFPKADVHLYLAVLPEIAKLSNKWNKVKEANFSTHKNEAHKVYASTLRNLIQSEKKLKNMVEETRADMYPSDTEEEAEEELYEDNHDDGPDETARQTSAANEQASKQIIDTPRPDAFPIESILKNQNEKKSRDGLLVENGDVPMDMQKFENLKRCHTDLLNAYETFRQKAELYRAAKNQLPCAITPVYIKNMRP